MENTELKNGERTAEKCQAGMESRLLHSLPDLLFDPTAAPVAIREHVEQCAPCRAELDELKATMALLDTWEGPEPSPYFFTRLNARMREERQAAPAGWFARLRARCAYLNITQWDQPAAPQGQAAVVGDLQLLDNNAQLLDQMEAMSNASPNGD
jgi:hypothetical protein